MKLFQAARLKLTGWYLLIIMGISISFSVFVYRQVMSEVRRGLRMRAERLLPDSQQFIIPFNLEPSLTPYTFEDSIYEDVQHRILLELLIVNAGIGVFSTIAGYFLAGKTLSPIEEMLEEQKRFTADASHELRTPLTSMKTEIEVALREEKMTTQEAKELLQSNLEEVDKMQKLSNYLLSLNRYHDKHAKLPLENINLKDSIIEAIQRTEHAAAAKKITVLDKTKSLTIHGNLMSLTELFTILLDNAVKYSHPQGTVKLHSKTQKNLVIITVEDQGIGIKSGELPYIFNRFYRADSSRSKTQIDGYGLGLSIAKNIVELHKGSITVESQPNKGSTFLITLPLA